MKTKKLIPKWLRSRAESNNHQLGVHQADDSSTALLVASNNSAETTGPTSKDNKQTDSRIGVEESQPSSAPNDDRQPEHFRANQSSLPTPELPNTVNNDSSDLTRQVSLGTSAENPPQGAPNNNHTQPLVPPPSKKFLAVKTMNAQHDLAVLHVAFILQDSADLRSIIIEIVELDKPGVRDPHIAFGTYLTWLVAQ